MTRRHEALVPLTHDHHHTLAQARRLKDAAGADDKQRAVVAGDFVNFYFGSALRHFHEEEELFFAPLIDLPETHDLVLQAVADHLRMHALVRSLKRQLLDGSVEQSLLDTISELLTKHVRFEEQELFPLVESLVPEAELLDLATAGRRDV